MTARELATQWEELFNLHASDLYPGRYATAKCLELAEQGLEIKQLAAEKQSLIVAHNYLYPEFHEIADAVGDSLGLSFLVRDRQAQRVDFQSVYFMAETAKIITGDKTRVFVSDQPAVLGCSLVFGTDHRWIENWREINPGGIVVTYINSDARLKAMSDFVSTSRNTAAVLRYAADKNPGKKILFCPDKFLGWVMRSLAGLPTETVDVYDHSFAGFKACCYVHEKANQNALENALDEHPEAELLIHPECGCASTCLFKIQQGEIPNGKSYFLSTEKMFYHARASAAKEFVVATEKGMVYRLRKGLPGKKFYPVSLEMQCDYMKANTLDKLLRSLREDRLEIILCDDCCDPRNSKQDEKTIHLPKSIAAKSSQAINRMLAIQ